MRILVAEDESDMSSALRQGLEEEGHSVVCSSDGLDALSVARSYEFDAIILDVMLPGMDGYAIARQLRQADSLVPILMLTARDAAPDMVRGLDSGADDYLTKPFKFEVLLARLRAISRRGGGSRKPVFSVGDLSLDPSTRQVSRGSRAISLSRTEYAILELLMRRAGGVVTREVMLDSVWGFDQNVEDNTIHAFVRLLRHKVDLPNEAKLIHTVRGIGYRLAAESHV